jgi:polyisoprenoid-binding protein YceI
VITFDKVVLSIFEVIYPRRCRVMKQRLFLSLLVSIFFFIQVSTFAATWEIDPAHSNFQFKIRHLTASNVKGDFSKARGIVMIDDHDVTQLKAEVTIDAASVNTAHAKRDEHLRSADFFDVAKYPSITFVSKVVTRAGADRLKVVGDLTIHGVTKEITLDVEGPTPEVKDPGGKLRRGATATGKIDRRDFGLTWSRVLDTGGLVVGNDVDIYVEVELVKK